MLCHDNIIFLADKNTVISHHNGKYIFVYQRPFPLQGRFMANLFIHFEPVHPDAKTNDIPIYRLPMKQSKYSVHILCTLVALWRLVVKAPI